MPWSKPAFLWLISKEFRELLVSRAWWVLLFCMGPMAGVSFISAVRTYAEVSGLNGAAAGVGEALSPLVGVWAPTFSAFELAAVFLLPFGAIWFVGSDRQSGALKLQLQCSTPPMFFVAAKALVLMVGWLAAMLPAGMAILLWKSYGGPVYLPEIFALTAGHLLNAVLTIALAAAMSSFADHPSTAAVLTLGVTVGTWVINFFGAIQGGWWERAAGYTPSAMVSQLQHGLVQLDTALIAIVLIGLGLAMAAIWMGVESPAPRKVGESLALVTVAALLIFFCTLTRRTWDVTENRSNSFSIAEETALRGMRLPLHMEVHLSPEDPRRLELERNAISKLRRLMPELQVDYRFATTIGLFEQTSPGYGEIWYSIAGRRMMSRVTTREGVLETIYSVARIAAPRENDALRFHGHPLAVVPRGASVVFYGVWPSLVLTAAFLTNRRFA